MAQEDNEHTGGDHQPDDIKPDAEDSRDDNERSGGELPGMPKFELSTGGCIPM